MLMAALANIHLAHHTHLHSPLFFCSRWQFRLHPNANTDRPVAGKTITDGVKIEKYVSGVILPMQLLWDILVCRSLSMLSVTFDNQNTPDTGWIMNNLCCINSCSCPSGQSVAPLFNRFSCVSRIRKEKAPCIQNDIKRWWGTLDFGLSLKVLNEFRGDIPEPSKLSGQRCGCILL